MLCADGTRSSARSSGPRPSRSATGYCARLFSTAVADELIVRNPCKIDGAGVERAAERPTATIEQVWQLADAMPGRYRCLVVLAGFLGLRLGELLGLERRHVNVLHRTLTVDQQQQELGKGQVVLGPPKSARARRIIVLPAFVLPEIEKHLAKTLDFRRIGPVCVPGERGGPSREAHGPQALGPGVGEG